MRLKIRLLILYSCVGIMVLAIVGSVLFVQVKNNRSADLEQEFQNQLMHLDFALTNLIEEAESDILQLSENELIRTPDDEDFTSFLNASESTFEYDVGETEQSIIDILNEYRTTHEYVNSVYMGRENGAFVRAQPRIPTQYDPRERPWYILAEEAPDKVVVTAPYQSITTTDVNLGVEKALIGENGEFYGVVGADITLNRLTDYMAGFNIGYQGHMLLTDENGTILAYKDQEFLFKNVEALLGNTSANMMNMSLGVITVNNESGSSYLYLYTSPTLGWKLAVMAPADVINSVIQGPVFIALFGLFIALVLLSLLTFLGLNISVINPLKRLGEITADITHSGDLTRKTGITSKNEIGTLAASFDRMTDTLREKEVGLRESEEKYREVVERANDGIVILQDGIIQYSNRQVSDIAGFEAREIIGTSMTNYIHPDELQKVIDRYKRRMAGESVPSIYETAFVRKDGHKIDVELNAGIIKYQGKTADMVIIRDITERKKAEKILSESESKLRTIFESVTDAVFVFDMNGVIREINRAGCEMHGYTYNELIGTHAKNLVAPESHKQFADYLLTVRKGQSFSSEAKDIRKDGTTFDIEARGVPIVWNGELHLLGLVRDITERKRAEEALLQEKAIAQRYLDVAQVMLIAVDSNQQVILINHKGCNVLGYEEKDIIGKNWFDLALPSRRRDKERALFSKLMAGEIQPLESYEDYIVNRSGEERFIEWFNTLLKDESGNITGILVSGEDITERKQAEEAVRKSESFLNSIIENTPNPLWVSDQTGTVIRMNQALRDLLRIKDAEIIGKYNVLNDIQVKQQGLLPLVESVFKKGKTVNFEIDYDTAKEKQVDLSQTTRLILDITIAPICNENGEVVNAIALHKNITERKKAEQALRESEKKFREMAELLPEIVFECNIQGNVTFANKVAFEKFGYTQKDFDKGVTVQQFIAPADRKRSEEDIKKIVYGTEKGPFEYIALRKDGSEFPTIAYSSAIIHEGTPVGLRGIIVDITERKRAEEKANRLAAIVQSSDDIIIGKTLDGIITSWNRGAEKIYGYTESEVIGKSIKILIPPGREDEVPQILNKIKSGEHIEHYETVRRRKDGQEIQMSLTVSPVLNAEGKIIAASTIGRDITERKKAEKDLILYKDHLEELVKDRTAQLDAAKITAEQANKAKSDFLANMSHEIRTPLSTIIGFSELLYDETKGPLNNDQKKYQGYVTSAGQHLLSLINDILDLSKVEAGKMELLLTRFSMADLLKNSLAFVAEKALKHNINLVSNLSADVDMIEADERKVKQILYNLISNAVKFTPDGGSVTISADVITSNSAVLPAKIRKGLPDTEYILISVKDTGIGIAKKDQDKIFTEFHQVEEPYSKKYEGTGLGLALSNKLVALHGGKIWFESKGKDQGCTFYFILPLK